MVFPLLPLVILVHMVRVGSLSFVAKCPSFWHPSWLIPSFMASNIFFGEAPLSWPTLRVLPQGYRDVVLYYSFIIPRFLVSISFLGTITCCPSIGIILRPPLSFLYLIVLAPFWFLVIRCPLLLPLQFSLFPCLECLWFPWSQTIVALVVVFSHVAWFVQLCFLVGPLLFWLMRPVSLLLSLVDTWFQYDIDSGFPSSVFVLQPIF